MCFLCLLLHKTMYISIAPNDGQWGVWIGASDRQSEGDV